MKDQQILNHCIDIQHTLVKTRSPAIVVRTFSTVAKQILLGPNHVRSLKSQPILDPILSNSSDVCEF